MKFAAILVGTIVSIFPMGESGMPHSPTNKSFRHIEQPLPVKIAVVFGGLTLIGTELWWFLGRKQQQQQATQTNGVQEVLITVDGGYRPVGGASLQENRVIVNVGEPVRLSFDRLDRNSCLDEVLIPDFGISTRLPVGQTTTVEFTPIEVGEYAFTCGMRMFRGVIEVKECN
jgi:plastocyanin domain-containing protein